MPNSLKGCSENSQRRRFRDSTSNIKAVANEMNATAVITQKELMLSHENTKILGMWWDTENDKFYFKLNKHRICEDIINMEKKSLQSDKCFE